MTDTTTPIEGCSYCNPNGWRERSAAGFIVMCRACAQRLIPGPGSLGYAGAREAGVAWMRRAEAAEKEVRDLRGTVEGLESELARLRAPAPSGPSDDAVEGKIGAYGSAVYLGGKSSPEAEHACAAVLDAFRAMREERDRWRGASDVALALAAKERRRAESAERALAIEKAACAAVDAQHRDAWERSERLRVTGEEVVKAWHACREANSMAGFWTVLDDLAAELDGRADANRRAAPLPAETAPRALSTRVIEGVEGPCDHHPGTDTHYHCVTCGCPVWLDIEHECPPGFDNTPRAPAPSARGPESDGATKEESDG
jgi:hypothetical protein